MSRNGIGVIYYFTSIWNSGTYILELNKKIGFFIKMFVCTELHKYQSSLRPDEKQKLINFINQTKEIKKTLILSDTEEPTFEEYGWFQFNSVKSSIEKDLSLEEAFNNLGLDKKANYDEEKLSYGEIDETTCDNIIKDTINKFKKWGMIYPEVTHTYSNDPNMNYSMPTTKENYELLK